MESLESAQQRGDDVEETPSIVHHDEGGEHDEIACVEETPNIGHQDEGEADGIPSVEESPNIVHHADGESDGSPCVGMKFSSEDEAYKFYNEYAAQIGFSVRKGITRKNSKGVLRQRNFVCSKEGLKLDDEACGLKKGHRLESRTDCKACIRFTVMHGVWEVTHFNTDHNHELANPEQRKFLRSNRRILEANLIASMVSAGTVCREEGEADIIPHIGMKVYSEDEAYNFYNEYATRIGFSIRKGGTRHNSRGVLRQRNFVCSKQGLSRDDDTDGLKKINRLEMRTDCKASIRFTVTDGVWEVTHFSRNHNHELAEPEERKFLRSNRRVSKAIAGHITSISAGMRPMNTNSCLTEEVGRADDVRSSPCVRHDLLHTERTNIVEVEDVQNIMSHFKHKQAEDTMFFYAVQVDNNNQMTDFFWRDGRSRMDYDYFGDVVVFDTTFRTDKYSLVYAPFMGVNHHGKDVLFGCAFLLDETIPSFIWLFEAFLQSMGNRQPKTIYTNHCQAMTKAIEKVFPRACHRLCLGYILRNTKQHLPSLYANPEFKMFFDKCINDCLTVMEFQSTWDELIDRFSLAGNKWLNTLYDLRGKWCLPFGLGTFSANIRSTQRSERSSNVFQHMSGTTMNLSQFLHQYEGTAEQMRQAELEDDVRCNQGIPTRASRNSGMLKQAADVYTIEMFNLFQEEMVESLSIVMNEVSCDGPLNTYELTEEGHRRGYTVHFNSDSCTAMCSCKMFDSMGLLCRHALRVLNMRNITNIPAQYILKRWTKFARKGVVVAHEHGECSSDNPKTSQRLLRSRLMHKAFCAVDKCLRNDRGSEIADALLDQIIEQAERLVATSTVKGFSKEDSDSVHDDAIGDSSVKHYSSDELQVLEPPPQMQKGVTEVRLKSQLVKKRKRKSSKSNISPGKEKKKTTAGPSGVLFHPPEIPTFFCPSFHPSGVGMDANSYAMPTFYQGHFPPWAFGSPNFRTTSMLLGTDQMSHASQDSSTSFNANHAPGQIPQADQGNGSS